MLVRFAIQRFVIGARQDGPIANALVLPLAFFVEPILKRSLSRHWFVTGSGQRLLAAMSIAKYPCRRCFRDAVSLDILRDRPRFARQANRLIDKARKDQPSRLSVR